MKFHIPIRNNIAARFLLIWMLFALSCTKLDETLYHDVSENNYFTSADAVISNYLRPYAHLDGSYQDRVWNMNTLCTDEACWPVKDGTQTNNYSWVNMHRHKWTVLEDRIGDLWNALYRGIGHTNTTITNMQNTDFKKLNINLNREQVVAEMKCYRAWIYYLLSDVFGNIPIVEKVGNPINPPTVARKDVFQYIEKSLLDNISLLKDKGDYETVGHMIRPVAYALLAKLYLNAEIFTGALTSTGFTPGTARWDDCIKYCDSLINYNKGGGYQLDQNWNDPFKIRNLQNSKEIIFLIAYDSVYAADMRWNYKNLHPSHRKTYGFNWNPANYLATHQEFYSIFKPNDKRSKQWLVGPQFEADGVTPLKCLTGTQQGQPLVLDPNIPDMENAKEYHGARNVKYEIQFGTRFSQMSNAAPVFRLADVMLMKAEALMRKNGGVATPEAVGLVNAVRARCYAPGDPDAAYTTQTLTLDELLNERGRELCWEGHRRNDLIRFGKFTQARWDKPASEPYRILMPIPDASVRSNKNLKQNPGY